MDQGCLANWAILKELLRSWIHSAGFGKYLVTSLHKKPPVSNSSWSKEGSSSHQSVKKSPARSIGSWNDTKQVLLGPHEIQTPAWLTSHRMYFESAQWPYRGPPDRSSKPSQLYLRREVRQYNCRRNLWWQHLCLRTHRGLSHLSRR